MTILQKTKRLVHFTCVAVGALTLLVGLGSFVYFSNQPQISEQQDHIQHEFLAQAAALQHRIDVCNEHVDSMSPEYTETADFQCVMMWVQFKKFEAFVGQMHIEDPGIQPLAEAAMRTAARYAEYQRMLSGGRHPSHSSGEPLPPATKTSQV